MVPIRATYRLQLHAGFPLSRVRALVPYLSKLGISHIHCSPMLQARKGSTHGYDVTDPTRLNPELGTEEELAELVNDLRARDMGLVLDIVPNHMAASRENPAWEDVLTHGPASSFARWFDVEWRAAERELRYRVLLPILGEQRARVLQNNEISLVPEDGVPRVRYYEHSFPLDPSTLPPVLDRALQLCREAGWGEDPSCRDLRDIAMRLRRMPRRSNRRPAALARRRETAATELHRLRELSLNDSRISEVVSTASTEFGSGSSGRERLRRLLDAQVYRLVYWRRGARELNYRRFFDVNDLVALHMEDPEVFSQTHALVLQWRQRDWIDGFRIDHPDGLLDPLEYFRRLAAAAFPELSGQDKAPIFVEKILAPGEQLRADWPVAGTTGYDFLNQAENLYLDPAGAAEVETEYRRIIRQPLEFVAIARLAKRRALESGLSAGVRRLAERLLKLAGPDRPLPSVTAHALSVAIVETIASLPVYRTYLDPSTPVAEGEDRRLLEAALSDARARGRAGTDALDLLAAALLGLDGPMRTPEVEGLRLRFVQRFQQLSGPAMAKGVEDTAFYSFAPLLSRNEVGGSPESSLADSVGEFHRECRHRASRWPRALLAATTHDTKRSADVRSRLDVLSEIPREWKEAVERWRRWNRAIKHTGADRRDPDPGTVYHVLQALVGIWPVGKTGPLPDAACLAELRDRLTGYAIKAAREAKIRTNWIDPDQEFEQALQAYIEAILCKERSAQFLEDLSRFVDRISLSGMWNALSRTLLQLTAPGIPDVYQGDELWKLALVDPDNRRPVDFERRMELLEQVSRIETGEGVSIEALRRVVESPEDGSIKLYLIFKALNARRSYPDLFLSGSYQPLHVEGSGGGNLLAYAREWQEKRAIILTPRLLTGLLRGPIGSPAELELWQSTAVRLPAGWPTTWRCELSGERVEAEQGTIPVSRAFRRLPLSLLVT